MVLRRPALGECFIACRALPDKEGRLTNYDRSALAACVRSKLVIKFLGLQFALDQRRPQVRRLSKAVPEFLGKAQPMATEITKTSETGPSRPRDVFAAMRDEMERMFERFEHGWPRWPSLFRHNGELTVPDFDVRENTNSVVVEAELPGGDEKDVTVTLSNGVLTIRGEKKQDKEEKSESYYLAERSFGSFERAIRLPDTVDDAKVEAKFDKGVLKVTAAKKPEAVKPAERKIEIKKA
jgi:HSP20 family protein